jgi:3-hydroxy-9,10-secoandrosta-1,3,5(10)-triene-9,17-dione monooxygenase
MAREDDVESTASRATRNEPPSLNSLLALADAVGAKAERTAAEAEQNRKADDTAVRSLIESGLLKVLQPVRFGGYEVGFPAFVRISQTLARYDVSLSWVYSIIGIHHWWGALVEPDLQEELWGKDRDCVFVDSFAPTGRAESVDGGFRLSGKWGFLSGLPWAEWSSVGAFAPYEPGGAQEYLMFFLPKRDYKVLDDWFTVGLRGSASASIEAHDAFVPRHRVFRFGRAMGTGEAAGLAYNPGAIYRVPISSGLGIALVPPSVGGAQGVAERFRKAAAVRAPLFQQRQAELVVSQSVLAESMVTLEAIELMLHRYADDLMDIGREKRAVDKATRARLFAWRAYIARRAREVVGNLVDIAGARSIFENDPLQRFWRDVHAMGQHVALNVEAAMRNYGRVLMGLDPDVPIF